MVYKHYNQEELNDQYNNRLHVPDYADYFERWDSLSRQAETEYDVLKNISFGIHPKECLDIFPSKKPLAKTMIFIHGGYWHLLDKTMFHFIATTFLKHDVTTVFINYPLAPAASMNAIVLSCCNAIRWLHNNIIRFNGDPSQMYVMGHSAGGHLACMLSVEEDINFLRGVISLSGLFRLEPLMLSNLNDVLGMDTETAMRNSPVFLEPRNFCPFLLATGTDETDEFKSQSMYIYNSWKNKYSRLKLLKVKGKNHYSILDAVTEKDSALQSAIFQLMNI
jgi:arylformamidase